MCGACAAGAAAASCHTPPSAAGHRPVAGGAAQHGGSGRHGRRGPVLAPDPCHNHTHCSQTDECITEVP